MGDYSVHPDADAEIVAAVRWYLSRDPSAADGLAAAFERAVEMIRQFPELYPLYDHTHRFARLRKYPYSVIYKTDGTRIRVIAIPHDKQRLGYWAGRQ